MNKRGIAPLVATLLLISFAVALGIVVMTFGRAQVELEAQCPLHIGLSFSSIESESQICYDSNKQQLAFTVENGVNIAVEGLVVNVIGSQQAQTYELNDARIVKAGVYLGSVSYDMGSSGEIRQVKISPKIKLYDKEEVCAQKALIAEKIKPC